MICIALLISADIIIMLRKDNLPMERKKAKKNDGSGLYIAICCCILVVALIGYANNVREKNREEERRLTEMTEENITVNDETEIPQIPVLSDDWIDDSEIIEDEFEEVQQRSETVVSDIEPVTRNKITEDVPAYMTPVSGGVICEFSNNKPVYHETTGDYRTHNGVDIEATIGDSVAVCADGVVDKVYMNSLGYTVRVDHGDGMVSVYSNLDENPTVALGDNVNKGDVIGHVGNSAMGDLSTAPHLHFEIIYNGKYENPINYLN